MSCTHHYCSDNPPNIVCRKCGKKAPCDTRINRTMFGYNKYSVKQHYFWKGVCQRCGMVQNKIGVYVEVLTK